MRLLKSDVQEYRQHARLAQDDAALLKQVQNDYKLAIDATQEWREEVRELYDMIAGDQWDELTRSKMADELRPVITFNITSKYMDAVSGLEVSNRQEVTYLPRETGDSQVNEMLTNAAQWVRDEGDADDEESEAFMDMVLGGMGWTETYIDMEENPEGKIMSVRRDPLEMVWDRNSSRRNLHDCRWLARVRGATPEEIEERWPGKLENVAPAGQDGPTLENVFPGVIHDSTNAWRYLGHDEAMQGQNGGELPLMDYQWYTLETAYHVRTMQRGDEILDARVWSRMKQFLDMNGVPYEVEPFQRRKYYRAFIVGNTVLEKDESPYQDGFTYKCMTGRRDRNTNTWYGLGRLLRDPQLWINKFFSQILHTINSNSKGGIMAVREAFENPAKAEQEWAKPDSITWMDMTSDEHGNPTVVPKPVAQYPEGLDRLMMFTVDGLPNVTGLNLELLGLAGKVQAGVLEQQRKQAGMTMISWAFDSKRRYTKDQGRMLAYYIREYISDGRLIRINSEAGPQFVPLLRDESVMEYDVIVDESPTSPNMKDRVWALMMELIPPLLQLGYPVPPDILDYSPLPSQLVQQWKGMILEQTDNPQQQLQQLLAQLELQEKQADIGKTKAETQDELASARERVANALLKQAQAQAAGATPQANPLESHEKAASAMLKRAQAGKTAAETQRLAAETGRIMGGG